MDIHLYQHFDTSNICHTLFIKAFVNHTFYNTVQPSTYISIANLRTINTLKGKIPFVLTVYWLAKAAIPSNVPLVFCMLNITWAKPGQASQNIL